MKKWHVVSAALVLGLGLSSAYAQGRGGQGMGGQGMGGQGMGATPGQRLAPCTGQGPGKGQGWKQGRSGRGRGRAMMQNQTMQQQKLGTPAVRQPVGNNR